MGRFSTHSEEFRREAVELSLSGNRKRSQNSRGTPCREHGRAAFAQFDNDCAFNEGKIVNVRFFDDEILLATSDFEQQSDGSVVGQVDFHFGLEDPCFDGGAGLPELSDHAIDQRFGMFWSCCTDPTWPSTFTSIAVQRELADNEHLGR